MRLAKTLEKRMLLFVSCRFTVLEGYAQYSSFILNNYFKTTIIKASKSLVKRRLFATEFQTL
jgi:hypothetical protein